MVFDPGRTEKRKNTAAKLRFSHDNRVRLDLIDMKIILSISGMVHTARIQLTTDQILCIHSYQCMPQPTKREIIFQAWKTFHIFTMRLRAAIFRSSSSCSGGFKATRKRRDRKIVYRNCRKRRHDMLNMRIIK